MATSRKNKKECQSLQVAWSHLSLWLEKRMPQLTTINNKILLYTTIGKYFQHYFHMQNRNLEQQLKTAGEEIIKRLKELETSQAWIQNGDQPCLLYKMQVDGRIAGKGVKLCEFNIQTVVQFLKKEDSLAKVNPMLKEIKLLHHQEEPNIHYKIHYMEFSGIWPVVNRDFVNVAIGFMESDDKVYIGTKAFDYPYPEKSKVVRGQVYLGAYIIEKIDETHTKLTYISDADLKGWIPTYFKNKLSTYQGLIAHRVAEAIAKQRN